MDARELLKQGKLDETIAQVQNDIRTDPSNPKHRVFLFQLLCVAGRWDKALTQLNLSADLDPKAILMAQVCREALRCEALRTEIFEGKRQPLLFGEPAEWVGWMLQVAQLSAQGHFDQARDLRDKAFAAAPTVSGNIDGEPFEWIADADPRLGPMLEAVIEGKYYWIPLQRIHKIALDSPADLRDVVWTPATFTYANGGTGVGLIPTRYPGSESVDDAGIRLARRTDWVEKAENFQLPMGQRLFATSDKDYGIMDIRQITIGEPAPEAPAKPAEVAANG